MKSLHHFMKSVFGYVVKKNTTNYLHAKKDAISFFEHVLLENKYLHAVFYHLPGDLYWKRSDRRYVLINKDLEEKLLEYGVTKNQVIGKTDEEIFDADMAQEFKRQDEAVMRSGKEIVFNYEVKWHGEKIAESIVKRPICDELGHVVGSVGSFVSISHNDSDTTANGIRESDSLKLSFIRDMEHDIRTPMSGIVGLSRILYEKEQCPETKEHLSLIVRSSEELLGYCNGILEFSKISRGLYPTVLKSFDLSALLEKIINIEMPAAKYKNIQLNINKQNDMPQWVRSDSYRIEKILVNLIGNAIKFTSVGHVSIDVKYKRLYERNIIGYIVVTDTGRGIPETVQNYMYKAFARGESANRGLSSGIGIGLQVVKEFIHDLGGEVDISSEVNRGTKIKLSIPLQVSLADSVPQD